jgi:hypothetical protein
MALLLAHLRILIFHYPLSIWEQTKHPWIDLPEGIQHFVRARV